MTRINSFFNALDSLTDLITVAVLMVFSFGLIIANPVWMHHPAFFIPVGTLGGLYVLRIIYGLWQDAYQPVETEEIDLDAAEVAARVE